MQFYISKNYVPVSGTTVDLLLQRDTDDYYWSGTAWVTGVPSSTLEATVYDSTNYPGLYYYDYTPDFVGDLYVHINYTDSESVVRHQIETYTLNNVTLNDLETDIAGVQTSVDNIEIDGVNAIVSGVVIVNHSKGYTKIQHF